MKDRKIFIRQGIKSNTKKQKIYIKQGLTGNFSESKMDAMKWMYLGFSNIFQLLPIWIMMLIQMVSRYSFKTEEFINNLLVFTIVACATNLSDLFKKKSPKLKDLSTMLATYIMIFILCFVPILYCLILLYTFINLDINLTLLHVFSILLASIVVLLNIWQGARRKGKC